MSQQQQRMSVAGRAEAHDGVVGMGPCAAVAREGLTPKNMKSVSISMKVQNVGTAHIVQFCARQLIKNVNRNRKTSEYRRVFMMPNAMV